MPEFYNAIIYPFLFITLFLEVFVILTFFDNEARRRRNTPLGSVFPTVTIIVPCFNESATLEKTVESLLSLRYPKDKLFITLVDDGSTDETPKIMERYRNNPHISILRKENGGKHTALNEGIKRAKTEFVGCLDADSFVQPDALSYIMSHFDRDDIGAVTAALTIHQPQSIIERVQEAEYFFAVVLRHTFASINGLHVTPGPFTIFRKKIFNELGLFRSAHQTEDMEIALRLQKAGWKIQNAPRAVVMTKAPKTVAGLVKQRTRWTTGFLRNSIDYRDLIGNPKNGILGLMVMPLGIFSVFTAVLMLYVSIASLLLTGWDMLIRALEVPISYSLSPTLDLFFTPLSMLWVISFIALVIVFWFITEGARITGAKARSVMMFVWYFVLYTFVSGLWHIRALYDVAFGVKRSWR